ncbi:MAG: hypothetical protein E6L03_01760 [Thaumarchaeota archaeon]|nr:MAG: hypothetical protein E6L03_01760 [Nitrososphaerota archaeon]
MKTLYNSIFLLGLILFLTVKNNVNASEQFVIQVWLADVNSGTGKVQLCVDVLESGASSCKRFDASASSQESKGKSDDPIVIDGGIYKFNSSEVPQNSTILGCVYVFNSDTGYCSKEKNTSTYETSEMMLFTKVKPVYYDKDAHRLYKFGECYKEKDGSKLCIEDEGVAFPESHKLN